MQTWNAERVSLLAERLRERKRPAMAVRVYKSWMDRQAETGQPPGRFEWMRLGRLLRAAGDPAKAAQAIGQAVNASNSSDGPDGALVLCLGQLAACLDEAGDSKSASETRALRDRTAEALREDPDAMRAIAPAEALLPAVSRCTEMMAIEWQSAAHRLSTIEEDGFTVFRDRVRLSLEHQTWAEFEAKAPVDPECSYPHVELCARLPWRFTGTGDLMLVLDLVNAMNLENSAVSACLEPDSKQIAARCRLAFTGFNQDTARRLPALGAIHVEITINLMLELLNTLSGWQERAAALAQQLGADETSDPGGRRGSRHTVELADPASANRTRRGDC